MKGRYFTANIDGHNVRFNHEANHAYSAMIFGQYVYGSSLKEISDKVRERIAERNAQIQNPK